jgi:hypothetical protein
MGRFRIFSRLIVIASLMASISFLLNGSADQVLGASLYPIRMVKASVRPGNVQVSEPPSMGAAPYLIRGVNASVRPGNVQVSEPLSRMSKPVALVPKRSKPAGLAPRKLKPSGVIPRSLKPSSHPIVSSNPVDATQYAYIYGLHASGNQIVNGLDEVIRPLGVDRSGTEYECISNSGIFDGPHNAAAVDAMASWHVNTVRIPLNEDCWLGINGISPEYSGANYQMAIEKFVRLLNSRNIMVILEMHWNAPGTALATGQKAMPDADHALAFWQSVAETFKNNTSVMFDLYNEPHPANWACWRNGGTGNPGDVCADVGFAVAGMQTLVNTVRQTGAPNLILLGGLNYANNLSDWLSYEPSDPLHNLAVSFHVYNFNACKSTSCWNTQVAPLAAKVPMVAEEIGENDCQYGFINQTMSWLDQHGIGYLAWAWDTYGCNSFPALISDYSGTPTPFGIGFKNHLAALAQQKR